MLVTWIAVIVNIILNYLFLYGRCGFPKFGIMGAAYGTLIVRIVLLISLALILKRSPKVQKYTIGVPTGLQMLFEVGTFTAATFIVILSDKNN